MRSLAERNGAGSEHTERRTTLVRARRWESVGGAALIVAGVLVVLHPFWLGGRITGLDVRDVWLPTYCFLGKTLAAGHIPAWNPYLFAGTPFAADPQSGWLNLPAMALFTALPCDLAIRLVVVLNPLLAGLGLRWFLRTEGLSSFAATSGGLALALGIAASELTISVPLAGALAWTVVTLGAASRFVRARAWPGRLAWAGLAALAWGQVAAAHMSGGLVAGTLVLVAYLAATAVHLVRRRTWTGRDVALRAGVLLALLLGLNLALLLPRLALAPRTSLALGYGALQSMGEQLAGKPAAPLRIGGTAGAAWPLSLAGSGGAYLGAAVLALGGCAWRDRSRRHLVAAFGAIALVAYLLPLGAVAGAVPRSIQSWPPVDLYLHSPEWFAYPLLVALAVVGALGLEAMAVYRDARRLLPVAAAGLLAWLVLPVSLGMPLERMILFTAGVAAAVLVVSIARRRPALIGLMPVVLAVELAANGLAGGGSSPAPLGRVPSLLGRRPPATVDAAALLRPGPLVSGLATLPDGRYAVMAVPGGNRSPGRPAASLANQGLPFGIENAGGYDPVQLLRYWIFVRAAQGREIRYNRALFASLPAVARELLQVNAVMAPGAAPAPFVTAVARDDGYDLITSAQAVPRASVHRSWRVVPGSGHSGDPLAEPSLRAVLSPAFAPWRDVLVAAPAEGPSPTGPTLPAEESPGEATYHPEGTQAASLRVRATAPSVVLIRNAWDPNWHATVDGRPVPVLRVNYFLQGVAVPAGAHTILLAHDDPWIGYGLLGSGVALLMTFGVIALSARARSRRRRPS